VALKPAPSVVFQEVEGETVFLDLEGERYYVLDDVGTRYWQLLLEHGDVERIVSTMLAEFDVDQQTLCSDLDALLAGLQEARLVVPAESGD
jgi:hypothetical protein